MNLNALTAGVVNGRHTICAATAGWDPHIGAPLKQFGDKAGGEADVLAYTFTVGATQTYFAFRYAVVLQNPQNHSPQEQPFFQYYLLPGSSIYFGSGNMPFASRSVVADKSDPFFTTRGDLVYRDWTPTCIDVSKYRGKAITIVFVTADCSLSIHYGYAYIDGLCKPNNAVPSFVIPRSICRGAALIADGTTSENETSHFWSVERSDANSGRNPQTERYEWFVAQQAGPINLTNFCQAKGLSLDCNTYYRVKLAVNNDCTAWAENVQLVQVTCPPVDAGPDLCLAGKSPGSTVQLGATNPAGSTYSWTPPVGLSSPVAPSPLHTVGSTAYPAIYSVKVTDQAGCTNTDSVTLYSGPPTVALAVAPTCCATMVQATVRDAAELKWSTGETGTTSILARTPGTYTLTATNACGSTSKSINVGTVNGVSGPLNPICYNHKMSPTGAYGLGTSLFIIDPVTGNGASGVPNAYNATDYRLRIFNRWGELIREISGHSCTGFPNWSIAWDGRYAGALFPTGVYVLMVHFKNCIGNGEYSDWRSPLAREFIDAHCTKWRKFLGLKLKCLDWDASTWGDIPFTHGAVTVLY